MGLGCHLKYITNFVLLTKDQKLNHLQPKGVGFLLTANGIANWGMSMKVFSGTMGTKTIHLGYYLPNLARKIPPKEMTCIPRRAANGHVEQNKPSYQGYYTGETRNLWSIWSQPFWGMIRVTDEWNIIKKKKKQYQTENLSVDFAQIAINCSLGLKKNRA